MKGWIAAGILALGACSSQPSAQPQDLERKIDHYNTGIQLKQKAESSQIREQRKELYASALDEFKIAEKQPGNAYGSILNQAECLAYLWQNDAALERVNQALKEKPTSQAYVIRGLIQYNLSKYNKSIDDCTKALELENSNTNALWVRAIASIRSSGDKKEILLNAREDAEKYINSLPGEPDGHCLLSNIIKVIHLNEADKAQKDALLKQYYASVKKLIDLTDEGKKFRHPQFGFGVSAGLRERYTQYASGRE